MSPPNVAQALKKALDTGIDRLDAQILLSFVLARPRSWLPAHGEHPLEAEQTLRFEGLCARRADGEPVAYLVGRKEFHGIELQVDPSVLVPRPDTETLVDWALELLEHCGPESTVVDMGTGSGAIAIAIAIANARPQVQVCGVDVSKAALAVARANAQRLGVRVDWLHSDWWSALAGRRFDLIVANPPYIAADDPHLPALRHEPQLALTPGGDGLAALRILVTGAREHLSEGGWLLLEHGHDQAGAVHEMLRQKGFATPGTRYDLAGHARCSGGQNLTTRR